MQQSRHVIPQYGIRSIPQDGQIHCASAQMRAKGGCAVIVITPLRDGFIRKIQLAAIEFLCMRQHSQRPLIECPPVHFDSGIVFRRLLASQRFGCEGDRRGG